MSKVCNFSRNMEVKCNQNYLQRRFNVVNYKYVHKIFYQIQRLIAIRCCGGYKTISGESAIILSNFMPLDLYIKQKASEFYLKRGIINFDINCYLNACGIDSELFQKPAKLKDSNSTNELIFNIYETYYKLLEHNIKLYINFTHISAFEEYNLVESLSKESINSHNRIEYELIPNSRIKRIIYEKNIEMWNRRWNACTVGSGTKKYFQNINDRLLVKKFYKNDFYLTQVLTNHANFGQYLNRFKLKSTKVCDFCGHESDDSEHKMIFSPQFELKRI